MNTRWPELALRWKGALGKYRSVLLVVGLGVLLLLLPTGEDEREPKAPELPDQGESFVLEDFEEKLSRTLSGLQGAGETRVVLTLERGSRQVLAQDQERDGSGGGGSTTVTLGRGRQSGGGPTSDHGPQLSGGAGGLSRRRRPKGPAEVGRGGVRADGAGSRPDLCLRG